MQQGKELDQQTIIERYFHLSRKTIGISTLEFLSLIQEMEQLFLLLLTPYFFPIDDPDDHFLTEEGQSTYSQRELYMVMTARALDLKSSGLSFVPIYEAYSAAIKSINEGNFSPLDKKLPLTKEVALNLLQVLNLVIMRSATLNLAFDLKESPSAIGRQLSNEIFEQTALGKRSVTDKKIRDAAQETSLGAASDGITHLAALVELMWKQEGENQLSDLVQRARKHLVSIMTSYHSWEIQMLDTMILVNKNPYQLSVDDELTENETCKKFKNYIAKTPLNLSQPLGVQFLTFFEKSATILDINKRDKEAAIIIIKAVIHQLEAHKNIWTSSSDNYMSVLSNGSVQERKDLLCGQSLDRSLRRNIENMSDALFLRAIALAELPAKVFSLQQTQRATDATKDPRCVLLNVPGGLGRWLKALSESARNLEGDLQ